MDKFQMQKECEKLQTVLTDSHRAELEAVEGAFGRDVDIRHLVLYGPTITAPRCYSPASCIGAKKVHAEGKPDIAHFSISYVERQNLTMRMSMRRFAGALFRVQHFLPHPKDAPHVARYGRWHL